RRAYRRRDPLCLRPQIVVPAKAGTHPAVAVAAEQWVPAYAGTTMLGSRQPCERADIGEAIQAQYRLAQFAAGRGAERGLGQRVEFGREAVALRGDVGARDAGVMLRLENPSVGQRHLQLGGGLRPALVEVERELLA